LASFGLWFYKPGPILQRRAEARRGTCGVQEAMNKVRHLQQRGPLKPPHSSVPQHRRVGCLNPTLHAGSWILASMIFVPGLCTWAVLYDCTEHALTPQTWNTVALSFPSPHLSITLPSVWGWGNYAPASCCWGGQGHEGGGAGRLGSEQEWWLQVYRSYWVNENYETSKLLSKALLKPHLGLLIR
jgi:hypothetical protein